jgi:hypothetical protein
LLVKIKPITANTRATPCEAGALPLAVFITYGQRQADYETSSNLLKYAVGENLFGGQHYSKVFITDDS